jgi:hypothetical protein
VAFLLFDSSMKIFKFAPAVEGTAKLGYPANSLVPMGIALLVSTLLYAIPRTSILGAILLTGYLGGATATHVRVGEPWFLFPVFLGVLAWLALYLRDAQLREFIPLRSSPN